MILNNILLLLLILVKTMSSNMIVKELVGPTNGFMQKSRSILTLEHDLIFAVQQKNLDQIEKILNDVSDPHSPNYGKHLTKEEVNALTANNEGKKLVLEFLNNWNAVVVSSNDNYITAKATIEIWNQALSTTFYDYENVMKGKTVQRCMEYSLPVELASQVASVMGTVQFPATVEIGHPRIGRIPLKLATMNGHE